MLEDVGEFIAACEASLFNLPNSESLRIISYSRWPMYSLAATGNCAQTPCMSFFHETGGSTRSCGVTDSAGCVSGAALSVASGFLGNADSLGSRALDSRAYTRSYVLLISEAIESGFADSTGALSTGAASTVVS